MEAMDLLLSSFSPFTPREVLFAAVAATLSPWGANEEIHGTESTGPELWRGWIKKFQNSVNLELPLNEITNMSLCKSILIGYSVS